MASPYTGRTAALSLQLSQAHNELRRRLAGVRSALGRSPGAGGDSLTAHCLAFCAAMTIHHQGEDEGMFTALLRERPDLEPTVAKLVEDHGLIAAILTRVRDLADQAAGQNGAALESIGRELDGLAAVMESHFIYEERAVGAALDTALDAAPGGALRADDGWTRPVLRLRPPYGPKGAQEP
ncbi:hemerythrin domain-containing protein [Kitasatospora sp. NPDC101157]|uniref:hemerythrin domain-containing protein n=1 Tax=Kitasatospora sp. NPDC101157 TaxID=3364098 RepID=UPI0037FD51BE